MVVFQIMRPVSVHSVLRHLAFILLFRVPIMESYIRQTWSIPSPDGNFLENLTILLPHPGYLHLGSIF